MPDYPQALQEMARVLRKGGKLLLTTPFLDLQQETVTRAVVDADGEITHLLPAEYHGDPVSGGVLCFYHFGWDVLDRMRDAGFTRVEVIWAWSPLMGLLGQQPVLVATRA